MSVPFDFSSGVPLRYIHRRDGGTDIFFLANPQDRALETTGTFRVEDKRPEIWDPVTGARRDLARYSRTGGLMTVPLRFEPYQSFFIVFREPATAPRADVTPAPNFPTGEDAVALTGPWDVSFDPKWGGPAKITFDALGDWSLRPEPGLKYYSGRATYRRTFDLPRAFAGRAGLRLILDLGVVKNIARVLLNGRDLGVVWCDPWRVDITPAVKAAGNLLEIEVANLWPNRLIGDEQEPPDAEYSKDGSLVRWPDWLLKGAPRPSAGRRTFATWRHFTKDSPLLPSGLLGPVTLRAARD
jgi:hypothetical protein